MRLETLALQSLTRFHRPVRLDLRTLPEGLIAITGENGAGKTTLLEAPFACLYRTLPSRNHDVVDYVTAADGFIETSFTLEGRGLFRARLNLDGPHRKSDAVLQRILPDGVPAYLNDGKVTTYDAAVKTLLPPPELLLASVFAAQNRFGSFITSDRKARKDLFSTLLGLAHYEQLADRARQASLAISQRLQALLATRDVLAREASPAAVDALHDDAQALQTRIGTLDTDRRLVAEEIAKLDDTLRELAGAELAYLTAQGRLTRIDDTLTAKTAAIARLDARLVDHADVDDELTQIARALTAKLADADVRIANNQKLLDGEDAIAEAIGRVDDLNEGLERLGLTQASLNRDSSALRDRELALTQQAATLDQAAAQLARATADAALLQHVPCGGAGEFASCPLLRNAQEARHAVAHLQESVDERPVCAAALDAVRADLRQNGAALVAAHTEIVQTRAAKAEAEKLASKAGLLSDARTRIASYREARTVAMADAEAAVLAAHDRAARRRTALHSEREALAGEVDALQRERPALVTEVDRTAVEHAQAEQASALRAARQREFDATTAPLERCRADHDHLARRIEALRTKRVELDAIEASVGTLRADLAEWDRLAKCFGRDGLPVLDIDAAGPEVSDDTNRLLEAAWGPLWRVELVTQERKASTGKDGSTHKDTFELKIYPAGGGPARDLSDLSGGEQVIVDEALKTAIAIFVNRRYAHPIRTMWRDETTGALDPENALRYMAMVRHGHTLGGFHQTFFISHNPDAAMLADAQLRVADGDVTVAYPPYQAAA